MNPDSKTRLITIAEVGVLVAVLVVGLLIGWYVSRHAATPTGDVNNTGNTSVNGAPTSTTVTEVPKDIRIPDAGEKQVGDIAVPTIVTEAAPNVEARARSYSINVTGNQYSPSTIVGRVGDTITIRFTATDKDYDYTQPDLGLSAKLLKGKEQIIQVAPTATGKFKFFCSSCGGPDKGPVGYLVVAPKE